MKSPVTHPDEFQTELGACSPLEMSQRPDPTTTASLSTVARQEQIAASPASEPSTEVFYTIEYPKEVLGLGDDVVQAPHEIVPRRPSPTIGANPPTSAQQLHPTALLADQSIAEAPETARFSSEAFDEDYRSSKRHCDRRPLFACHLCPKSFTRRTTLTNHQRQHTGERPFHCEFTGCDESFAQNNDRKRHEKTHGTEKAFHCGGTRSDGSPWGCGKAFARKDGLLEHHHKTVKGGQCLARRDAGLAAGDDG
jgi:hypothetical protein